MRGLDIHLGGISCAFMFNSFAAARSSESVIDLSMPVVRLSQTMGNCSLQDLAVINSRISLAKNCDYP